MAFERVLLLVHFVLSAWLISNQVTAAESDGVVIPFQASGDSNEDTNTVIQTPIVESLNNRHSTLLVYEGDDQDLVCDEEAVSKNAQSLWLKNGLQFEGEIETLTTVQRFVPTIRSTLTIRAVLQSDNGIYTCIIINEAGKPSLKTFDVLVTASRSADVMDTLFHQSGITAIIVVMTALIILMAIATALSYRLFCSSAKADTEQLIIRKPSKPSLMEQFPRCYVLGNEGQNRYKPPV